MIEANLNSKCAISYQEEQNRICSVDKDIHNEKVIKVQNQLRNINDIVKQLESSLVESQVDEQQLLMQIRIDKTKNTKISTQLERVKKENKQILNILQQQSRDGYLSRSYMDNSYSTISMVNLQYKYEELLDNYQGLLKVMTKKDMEIKQLKKENTKLLHERDNCLAKFYKSLNVIKNLCNKYLKLKQRKDTKVKDLTKEIETLKTAHDKLVKILQDEFIMADDILAQKIYNSSNSKNAQFLQEIQLSNKLRYENIMLKHELDYAKYLCNFNI